MSDRNRRERLDLLELDVDARLEDLRDRMFEMFTNPDDQERAASLMRAAYGKGYVDCLGEETVGQLCRDHGYRIPRRGTETSRKGAT